MNIDPFFSSIFFSSRTMPPILLQTQKRESRLNRPLNMKCERCPIFHSYFPSL